MAKSAQSVAQKFVERAGAASGDYVQGAQETTKDQAARAIAAKAIYQQSLTASFARGAYEKGLSKAGKSGWLRGITEKGSSRFAEGVAVSAQKYATESGKYDSARAAADSMPRGLKGSATNLAKVAAVVNALRQAKTGSAGQ